MKSIQKVYIIKYAFTRGIYETELIERFDDDCVRVKEKKLLMEKHFIVEKIKNGVKLKKKQ